MQELARRRALLVVPTADAESVGKSLVGILRIGRARRDLDDLGVVIDPRRRDRAVAVEMPNHRDHAVVDQALGDVHRLVRLGLIIERNRLDLFPEHAALGVPFVDGDLGAVEHRGADRGVRAGLHGGEPDLDRRRVLAAADHEPAGHDRRQEEEKFPHAPVYGSRAHRVN